jgi:hypothetical protein
MLQVKHYSPYELRRKQRRAQWLTGSLLCVLGVVLEVVYLALYPWLDGRTAQAQHDVVRGAWETLLPWFSSIYQQFDWTAYAQHLYQWPAYLRGHLYPLVLLLLAALLLVLLAAAAAGRSERVLRYNLFAERPLFVIIFMLTCAFGLTMLVSPIYGNIFAQDMFLSGLAGRMVVSYHLNPYVLNAATATALNHDSLQQLLNTLVVGTHYPPPPFGPVWIDVSVLIALISRTDVAGIVLSLRILALLVHLVNVLLLWSLLASLRPWQRIGATILYAWNPLILLLGVSLVHQEIVVVLLLLLAFSSMQRNATILSWVFVLLAALVNLSYLLLLPLFFCWLVRQTRFQGCLWRIFWLLGMSLVSALVIFLAYIPYWQGWSVMGMLLNIRQVFWQKSAINSLNAVVLVLPLHLPAKVMAYVQPAFWSLVVLGILTCYLLFVLWVTDTLNLVIFCGGWFLLFWLVLMPVYWPWYLLVPLFFALCAGSRKLTLCAVLLTGGALLCFALWQLPQALPVEGLFTIGIPCLLWGWSLFFTAFGRMFARRDAEDDFV